MKSTRERAAAWRSRSQRVCDFLSRMAIHSPHMRAEGERAIDAAYAAGIKAGWKSAITAGALAREIMKR